MYKDLIDIGDEKTINICRFQPKNRENKHSNHSLRLNLVHATSTPLGLSTFQPFE